LITGQQPPWRVLIADDHAPTRADVRRALAGDARFDICAEEADAPGAVQAAIREKPDLCLLDLSMPGSGLATIWEIAARLPNTKIVVLTVSEDDDDLFTAVGVGVDGYLQKTMDFNRLPEALNGVCSGEAAMPRSLVAKVLDQLRHREPRWRRPASLGLAQRLTSREWEVLGLLAQGRSTAAIAEELVLSASAVRVHVASIVRKLRVTDRHAAIELFQRRTDG
jgi:DNA-binding NarL/FixJ family response regulator